MSNVLLSIFLAIIGLFIALQRCLVSFLLSADVIDIRAVRVVRWESCCWRTSSFYYLWSFDSWKELDSRSGLGCCSVVCRERLGKMYRLWTHSTLALVVRGSICLWILDVASAKAI